MKINFNKIIFSVFFTLGILVSLDAQQTEIEKKAKEALKSEGITEDELRLKFAEKGIDYDDISTLDIDQAILMQKEIESAILEIKEENFKIKTKDLNSAKTKRTKVEESKKLKNDSKERPGSKEAFSKKLNQINDTNKVILISKDTHNIDALWGQHIFNKSQIPNQGNAQELKPPDSYVLGIGDQVTVTIWGLSQLNESYLISEEGSIQPERMPRIFLKGLPIPEHELY